MKLSSQDVMLRAVADWRHRGLIGAEQQALFSKRYEVANSFGKALLQWLGLAAIFLLGLGILGLLGILSGSLGVGVVLLGGAAAVCWWAGVKMCTDPLQRYGVSGAVLVTVALILAMACMSVAAVLGNGGSEPPVALILFVTAALSLGTAYFYRLRWLLLFGLLCFFHAVGSSNYYGGSGSYFFNIQDPRVMPPVAAVAALFGLWHQLREEDVLAPWSGFGRLYVIFGLLYFNCVLWFLSLRGSWGDHSNAVVWVLIFTGAAIAQIIAGARLADAKLTGFGVVFLSIDLYTRFFEHFWDKLSMGLFFLLAGVAGLGLGFVFELMAKRRAETGADHGTAP